MYCLSGENSTNLYLQAVKDVMEKGEKVSPRGKLVKELRPACIEFNNPYNRVTFLGGRRINPFFQVAESLWILSGKADVEWLEKFNASIGQFSDDGKWFNAAYGERMRSWNKNNLHNIVINPIDQLVDVYRKLVADKDTRQAVIVLSNPMFDNSNYTVGEKGKDIACNLVITFKIRDDKLNMTVFNRSNDVHWGVFGANLCQFTTIQEVLLNWLKGCGKEGYENLEIGTYSQITDSLHIYLDSYGASCTNDVVKYYEEHPEDKAQYTFSFDSETSFEPRMALSADKFDAFLSTFWSMINPYLMDDSIMRDDERRDEVFGEKGLLEGIWRTGAIDDYWHFAILSMVVYRLVKLGELVKALKVMNTMTNCQWKVSMLFFLKTFVYKEGGEQSDKAQEAYNDIEQDLVDHADSSESEAMRKYLNL